eukprot:TRINITY_DN5379_c0_g1_i1.p1 TRINITY_DN5379_c0_g1~~TRINITY_DN5379_c0_g1_i1.p1  ORF type:complete len:699 (+),score=129.08 TRINITY_DN5379_c0_g1_i1:47-2098(+)
MNSALSGKINKVLETRVDQTELLSAAKYVSGFYSKNSLSARRNLRGDIEKHTVSINHQFLSALEQVQNQLTEVERQVSSMRSCCDNMSDRLKNTRAVAGKIIARAQKLQEESEHLQRREEMVTSFLNIFHLTPEETNALYATQLDEHFFHSLKRVQQIHGDCKILLRTQHRAGLEIMDLMTIHEQAAYNRLYRWIQAQCKELDLETPEPNPVLKAAIAALRERPVLFNSCLEEIESARCKAIVKGFLDALTKGSVKPSAHSSFGSQQRPIELHAHDSVRYVGDMLAWIHQAVASESELISSLLSIPLPSHRQSSQMAIEPLKKRRDEKGGEVHDITQVLDKCFEGVCRPFKLRFDQVLELHQSANEVFVVYKLVNLVDFYHRTINKIMNENSSLSKSLLASKNDSLKRFYDLLKDQADMLQRAPPTPPGDLSPPGVLQEILGQLVEVMSTFNHSLVPVDQREAEFRPVLIAVIDPLLQMCTLSATHTLLNAGDVAVYMINCLSLMQATLIPYSFASSRVERLAAQIDAHTDSLVDEEVTILLANCSLADKIKTIQEEESSSLEDSVSRRPLSTIPGLDSKSLSDSVHLFESLLFDMAQNNSLPLCDKIINTRLRSTARSNVLKNLAIAYSSLYEAVNNPFNGYPPSNSSSNSNSSVSSVVVGNPQQPILRYQPQQIQTILGVS